MEVMGATIVDARGRRVPLVRTLTIMSRGDPGRNERLAAASQGHRDPPTRREIVRAVTWGLVMLPILLVAALLPSGLAFGTSLPWWAQILAAIPIGAVPVLGTLFLVRRIAGERLAKDWVRA
ncbi:MAG: hypothetical protein FJ253_07295, partial [Phycisphaerae bacterium]|nr:hypothetical protein [Phycisphaerae bacterium]